MAFENKPLFFKVKTLGEMCKHFEITSNSRDTKSTLAKKKMVEDCSFAKKYTQCKFQTIISVYLNSTTLSMTFVTVWFIWIVDYT